MTRRIDPLGASLFPPPALLILSHRIQARLPLRGNHHSLSQSCGCAS